MASRKENLKSLFSNTRTRVIIIFTAIVLLVAILIGYIKITSITTGPGATADLPGAPRGIQSIPGALEQTPQYAKLQEEQNINKAIEAEKKNTSAIPTIISTQAITQNVQPLGSQSASGFQELTQMNQESGQKSLWNQTLKEAQCSRNALDKVIQEGAQLIDTKDACSCVQLKDAGFKLNELEPICNCRDLKAAGFGAAQMKEVGYSAGRLRDCGFTACETRGAGFSAQEMKDGGYSDGELKGAGFSDDDIAKAGALPDGITAADVRRAGCSEEGLRKLRQAGVSASAIRRMSGCSAEQLKAAGYTAAELREAGFSAAELKKAGFSAEQLKNAGFDVNALADAGFTPKELLAAGFSAKQLEAAGINPNASTARSPVGDCSVESLKKAREAGVSALKIKQTLGCSAKAMKDAGYTAKELRNAGFTAAELKNAGFGLKDLKDAGFSAKDLKDAGFSAQELKDAGFSAKDLKDAGFTPAELKAAGFTAAQLKAAGFNAKELKEAGFSAADLKAAGFNAKDLKEAGFSAAQLKAAGFSAKDLKDAGFTAEALKAAGFSAADLVKAGFTAKELKDAGFTAAELLQAGLSPQELNNAGFTQAESQMPGLNATNFASQTSALSNAPRLSSQEAQAAANAKQLQAILDRQNQQFAEQKYQQKIQQRTSEMLSAANQSLQVWKTVSTQVYTAGNEEEKKVSGEVSLTTLPQAPGQAMVAEPGKGRQRGSVIKTGDVLFAVLDTAINSDEPGPILATIVSGKLKGSKLIGSFNLPSNADRMVISFNTLSVPGLDKTISISAYAIDPNTARTALSSRTNHHYLLKYGSLFASSFLQGFGNAFQSANTTVTIGGTGGGNNIEVSNGVGRSTLENAVIGLATVGKAWGQQAQQLFNTPTTVQVYSGTGVGILFTQDVRIA